MSLGFTVEATDGRARLGRLETAHGPVRTPAFMPVGTQAAVKGLTVDAVRASGAEMVLGNAYHLMIRPGADRVAELGGLHRFMNWPGPILTDSGGFQVMSLAQLRTVEDDGVVFRAHTDGSRHHLTPAGAVAIQHKLGSDITMVLDECTAYPASEDIAADAMRRSMRWAGLCRRRSCRGRGTASSASSRGASIRTCGRNPPGRSWRSASTAMPWAGSRWARARPACWRCSTAWRANCRREARAT